jgi:hypothetical protein
VDANPAQARLLSQAVALDPAFVASSPGPDVPNRRGDRRRGRQRLRFCADTARIALAPIVPAQMARAMRLSPASSFPATAPRRGADAGHHRRPALDRVVPVVRRREFVELVRDARYALMDRTGHSGW